MSEPETSPVAPWRAAYASYYRDRTIRNNRFACILGIIFMPAGITLDLAVYPDRVWHFMGVRLACSGLLAALWFVFARPVGRKHFRLLGLIEVSLPIAAISYMIFQQQGPESPYYAGLNIVLMGTGLILRWQPRDNLYLAIITLSLYLLACFTHQGPPADLRIFFNNLYFLVVTWVFIFTGVYFFNRAGEREFELRFELDRNRKELERSYAEVEEKREQVEESNRQLVELDRIKSHFFANISHELRTPLTLLLAPLEALMNRSESPQDEQSREWLTTMYGNGMRLLKLINDLLDLVSLESGQIKLKRDAVELGPLVRGIVTSVRKVAEDKRVRVTSVVPEDIGPLQVDRDKLEKVLLNLVFNSIKFTPAGGDVTVSVQREQEELLIRVKDTGMGISKENQKNLFQRFWQADTSSKRKFQGTGIGLALVRELVEAHGGFVEVDSEERKGTTMTVHLPYIEAEAGAVEEEADTTFEPEAPEQREWLQSLYRRAELFPSMVSLKASVRPVESYGNGKMPKVLIADDEPDMLAFLKSQLQGQFQVIEAVDGQQAIEKAAQFLPDIILLDMMMPEKDGLQACEELRERSTTRNLPIVMLTARADEETKITALRVGANDFLTKPFSVTELHVRLSNLIETSRLQRDLQKQNRQLENALEELRDTLDALKETETQLVQSEKMASLGVMSAGIIHEINNPLNFAKTGLYTLRKTGNKLPESDREFYNEILRDIEEGVTRVAQIVSDLRSFSHNRPDETGEVSVELLVTKALRFLSGELGTVKVTTDIPQGQVIWSNESRAMQVIINLLQNALDVLKSEDFSGRDPEIKITGQLEGGFSRLIIRDNGPGIPPAIRNRIFDPFFTTKDVGEGMGLGLSICYRIMKQNQGDIRLRSEVGKFCEFTLEFPLEMRELTTE